MPRCPSHPATELEPKKNGWYCEECGSNVLSYEQLPREVASSPVSGAPSQVTLDALPFPIAYPLAFAQDASLSTTERLNNSIFAAYQAMRTASLLLLADYLEVDASDRALDGAIRGLRMPHWGEWSELAKRLVAFWSGKAEGKPERPTRFPTLVDGWRRVGVDKADDALRPLLDGLPGLQGPARSPNDAVWKLRNDRAHRMGTHTPDRREEQEKLDRLLPLVEAMCGALFVPGAFTLLRRVSAEPLRVVRVHGPHRDLVFEPEPLDALWSGLFERTGVAALCGDEGVSVYPLFAPDEDELARSAEPVTLVDGVKNKSLVLLGVRSHAESVLHLGPLTAALARKQVELGLGREETRRWSLAEWSRTLAREDVAQLKGHKYFPTSYVERSGVDLGAAQMLERGGRALLLLGEAGSGKSSLLTRLVDRLVTDVDQGEQAKKSTLDAYLSTRGGGDVVLYLSGRQAFAGDASWSGTRLLTEAVLRRAGIRSGTFRDLQDFLARLEESSAQDSDRERRVWLVLDAINEADRFADLIKAVDELLPAVAKYPWLRLVLSCRTGAYSSLERRHVELAQTGGVFANERHLSHWLDPNSQKEVPYLVVRPFDAKTEGPAAYRLRAEALPARSCSLPYDALPPDLRELLLNPLHLHVFHETYAGQTEHAADLDESALLGAYLDRLCADMPSLRETLDRIGRHLVEHHTPSLPAEVADGWLDAWRRKQGFASSDRVVKLDPIEELVSASILMRPANDGFGADRTLVAFTFSHQRLCERVILRELMRQISPRTELSEEDLARFVAEAEAHPEFREYHGALDTIVAYAARTGRGEFVASLLDLPHDTTRSRLVGEAVKALGMSWSGERAKETLQSLGAHAAKGEDQRKRWLEGSDFADWLTARASTVAGLALAEARLAATKGDETAPTEDASLCAAALVDLGDQLLPLGRSVEARRRFEESLAIKRRLADEEPGRADLARSLANSFDRLGDRAVSEGRTDDARRFFEDGLAIRRRLSEAEPGRADLARGLAFSFERLGNLAVSEGHTKDARRFFEDGLAIARRLAEAEPGHAEFTRDLSVSFNKLGDLAVSEGRTDDARRFFEDGLVIARRLLEAEPGRGDLARDLSASLARLGGLAVSEGRSEDARRLFEDGLAILRRLSKAEPARADLARELSLSFLRLGDLAVSKGRTEDASRFFENGHTIRRRLLDAEPARADLARELSVSFDRLGELAISTGRTDDARRLFEEGLGIRRRLSEAEPERADLARDLSVSFHKLGDLAVCEGRTEDARRFFEDGLAVARRLSGAEPGRADLARYLSLSFVRLGDLAVSEGRTEDARRFFEDGLAVTRRLSEAEPALADLARDLFVSFDRLGGLALSEGRTEDARRFFDDGLAIARRLAEAEPERADLAQDLSFSFDRLGGLAVSEGRTDDARRFFEDGCAIRRRLSEAEPGRTDLAGDLSFSFDRLGDLAVSEGRTNDARRFFEDRLAIARRLSEAEPGRADLAQDLFVSFDKLGDLAVSEGRTEDARRFFEDGLAIRRRLSEAEPGRADLARDLSISYDKLGDLAVSEGRTDDARRIFEDGLAIRRRLSEAEPRRADLASDVAWSLTKLGDLAVSDGRTDDARGYFGDLLAIRRRLSEAEPRRADLGRNLVFSLGRLGDLAVTAGRTDDARHFFEDCLAVARRFSDAEPARADLARDLSLSFDSLGVLAVSSGRTDDGRRFFEDGLAIARRLSAAEPGRTDLARDLAVKFNKLGDLALSEGRADVARQCFGDCLAIVRRLSEAEPERAELAREMSVPLERLGVLAASEGRTEDARRFFEAGLAIDRRLSEAEPGRADLARDVAVSFIRLGDLAMSEGRTDDGGRLFADALRIFRRLPADQADSAELANGIAWSLLSVARCDVAAGRVETALVGLEAAVPISRAALLRSADPNHADTLAALLGLKARLAAPDAARAAEAEALEIRRRLHTLTSSFDDELIALLREAAGRRPGAEGRTLEEEAAVLERAAETRT